MNKNQVIEKINWFISNHNSELSNWTIKVANTVSINPTSYGCIYKCESFDDALAIKNLYVERGCKDKTNHLRAWDEAYKFVVIYI